MPSVAAPLPAIFRVHRVVLMAPGTECTSGSEAAPGPRVTRVVGRSITLPSNKNSSDVEIGRVSGFVSCNLCFLHNCPQKPQLETRSRLVPRQLFILRRYQAQCRLSRGF